VSNIETLDTQISAQIESRIDVEVTGFTDSTFDEYFSLYKQDGKCWISMAFVRDVEIPAAVYDDLVGQFTDEQQFNTDPEIIRAGVTYDEFHDKYYNQFVDAPALPASYYRNL